MLVVGLKSAKDQWVLLRESGTERKLVRRAQGPGGQVDLWSGRT